MKLDLPALLSPKRIFKPSILIIMILTALPLLAQRDPVFKQIDLPHRYYYREMYLPQLTTGPNAAAWELIFMHCIT